MDRVLLPVLVPLGVIAFVALVVFLISQVLLAVSTEMAVVVALLLLAVITIGAALLSRTR